MRAARDVLNADFLFIRHRILDVAAALDRIDRAQDPEAARVDARLAAVEKALEILNQPGPERAERVQMIFSREYRPDWNAS